MRRITDTSRRLAAVALFFLGAGLSLHAQEAFVKSASLESDQAAPGEYLYRLEIAYAQGHPGIEPKVSIEDASGIEILSLSVKPYRKTESEVLIDFRANENSEWSFPEIVLTWMAERLVVPPRPAPESASKKNLASSGGLSPAASAAAASANEPAWMVASRLPQAASAKAVGSFSVQASIDRKNPGVGDIAYLEFILKGQGDFARARAPVARIASGKAALGQAKRYPDYDARTGRGSLTFRLPLTFAAAGTVAIRVEAYPVFDPERKLLLPGTESSLSIQASDAPDETGIIAEKTKPGNDERAFPAGTILAALCLALGLVAGALRIVLASKSGAASTLAAKRASLWTCVALFIASLAFAAAGLAKKPAYDLVLGPNSALYAVPAAKARSWTDEGARARLTGKRVSADGEIWYWIVLEDSSSGWMRSKDVAGARAAPLRGRPARAGDNGDYFSR